MKTKIVVLIGLALCTMLLISPVLANEDDFVLGIYGNANEDDTIDMRDLTYVKLIFFGKKPETELADAKYDGKINPLDFIQIKLIIVGKEKELTLIDEVDRIVTVEKPVERMVVSYHATAGVIKALGAEDNVVGVGSTIVEAELLFPELSQLPSVGRTWGPDPESVAALEPDLILMPTFGTETLAAQLEGTSIPVVGAYCCSPLTYTETVEKLAYILNKRAEAEEYMDWLDGYLDTIAERVEGLSENDKPRVFAACVNEESFFTGGKDDIGHHMPIEMAGGISITSDLPGDWITVDSEWVIAQNPSIIVLQCGWPPLTFGYDIDAPLEAKAFREEFMSRPVFEHTDAVEDGEVYLVDGSSMVWRGWFLGQPYLAKCFHPELFEDLDPNAIHQEWLTRFQRIDYDLDEHGVFVYHPEEHPDGS